MGAGDGLVLLLAHTEFRRCISQRRRRRRRRRGRRRLRRRRRCRVLLRGPRQDTQNGAKPEKPRLCGIKDYLSVWETQCTVTHRRPGLVHRSQSTIIIITIPFFFFFFGSGVQLTRGIIIYSEKNNNEKKEKKKPYIKVLTIVIIIINYADDAL